MAMDKTHNSPAKGKSRDPIHWVSARGKTYRKVKSDEENDGTFLRICEVLQHGKDDLSAFAVWRSSYFRSSEYRQQGYLHCRLKYIQPRVIEEAVVFLQKEECDPGHAGGSSTLLYSPNPSANRPLEMDSAMPWVILQAPSRRVRLSTGDSTMKTYPLSFTATIGETLQKYIRVWNKTLRKLRAVEQAVIFLHQQEGPTRPGGSHTAAFVELAGGDESRSQYIFGDRFCGAEGVWRGTLQAGLHIRCGFDKCPKAMETYRLNFTSAVGETCEVAHFLTNDSEDIIVDILHFSPPCQTFSSAKTIAAATDSANEACIFSSRELLLKIKPRVATMEETSGLQERHKEFLYATIHTFVDLGYSIRWKFSEAIQ
ncbi:c5 cytosine methyltransferase DmtA [Coccidioides immitis RMSCC 3703]|uniref:DNA (cytosine-5-)-methyltransferase n=2 Tax=Coccidioides immitis TaxID=5501 RepID=A0A0J8QNT9_COCIT|nr:c5 cytosine methyltransferase DmtA [Coccidioides immitis RMSCC 2394]KMU74109.1 c5 cytosine methyltransferase DmtA [Coccidioides immitis RMSCC 3703]